MIFSIKVNSTRRKIKEFSLIEFLMAQKCKALEIYRRICDMFEGSCFHQKIFRNVLNRILPRLSEVERTVHGVEIHWLSSKEKIPHRLCPSLFVDFRNTAWEQRRLMNKLSEKAFGTVTKIRLIIITTFGVSFVGHNGITLGAGTGVGYRRLLCCYSGAVPR